MKNLAASDKFFAVFCILYFLTNLFYLDSFPFVHSDEAWLASLSRAMIIEKNPAAVEDFFKAVERNPHAVKILFHILQMPFIFFRFSISSVRVLSVTASLLSLVFFYKYLKSRLSSDYIAMISVILIAANVQFIYISRFARQEILILLSLSMQLYYTWKFLSLKQFKYIIYAGIISGLSVFIHPNSFLIFTGIIFYIISFTLLENSQEKKLSILSAALLIYTGINLLFFAAVISISLLMDNNFFINYAAFGSQHGTGDSLLIKILGLPRFLYKIINRIEGTYYLPDTAFQFYVFTAAIAALFFHVLFSGKKAFKALPEFLLSCSILGSIVLIGKYSPPSIIFFMIPMWITVCLAVDSVSSGRFAKQLINLILAAGIAANLVITVKEISVWKDYSYESYGQIIKSHITVSAKDSGSGKILAGTNTAFFLDYDTLCAYHDLAPLGRGETDFSRYIKDNNIKTIIWSEELDIIADERPLWNSMYGNIYSFLDEAKDFLKTSCTETARIKTKPYPVRIVYKMLRKEYELVFYSVDSVD